MEFCRSGSVILSKLFPIGPCRLWQDLPEDVLLKLRAHAGSSSGLYARCGGWQPSPAPIRALWLPANAVHRAQAHPPLARLVLLEALSLELSMEACSISTASDIADEPPTSATAQCSLPHLTALQAVDSSSYELDELPASFTCSVKRLRALISFTERDSGLQRRQTEWQVCPI